MNTIKFRHHEAEEAAEAWGFNCGPGALCAVLGKTPEEIRPDLLNFEDKRYTNPTLMLGILAGLRVPIRMSYRGDDPEPKSDVFPKFGLVRVQWGGPWTMAGVPMRVRYRKTHWIAAFREGELIRVFDVNAVNYGWLPYSTWRNDLIPWILQECVPGASGDWWPTHVIEIAE